MIWEEEIFGKNTHQYLAKIHFMVLAILKFQNVNWFIRNTDFPANRCWNISNVFRPKTPPTTPRSFIWHINFDGPKWKNYKLFFYMLVNLIINQINWILKSDLLLLGGFMMLYIMNHSLNLARICFSFLFLHRMFFP